MTTTIKNLTPHALDIVTASGSVLKLPPSGTVARCSSAATPAGTLEGITLSRVTFSKVIDLPAPEEGVLLVVSALVRSALPARADIASPGELVRNAAGAVIGCRGLIVN